MVDDDAGNNLDFIAYLRVLWRHRWIVAFATFLGIAGALGFTSQQTKVYNGTATILFISQTYTGPGQPTPLQPSDILTDIQLVQGEAVYLHVEKTLKRQTPRPTIAQVGTTDTATISVSSPDARFASDAANAYADAYIEVSQTQYLLTERNVEAQVQEQINSTQSQISGLQAQIGVDPTASSVSNLETQLGNLEGELESLRTQLTQIQIEVAEAPSGGRIITASTPDLTPVSPKPTTDAIIFGLLGLAVGIALALLRERTDDRIRNKEVLETVTEGLPTLGLIPRLQEWRDVHTSFLVAVDKPRSPSAEAYRGLRTSIQFLAFDKSVKILQITSPVATEGKTTTAANLAVIMAQTGQRVILVGCDLRRPRIHEFFGVSNDVGFTSVIVGNAALEDAIVQVPGYESLRLMPSGPIPPNPSELLGSLRSEAIFEALRELADLVIIDSPPVMPITDASVIATHVDGVLLIVAAGSTRKRDVRHSLETLGRVGARVVGVALNVASEADTYGYYRYGYNPRTRQDPSTNGHFGTVQNGNGADTDRVMTRRERRHSG